MAALTKDRNTYAHSEWGMTLFKVAASTKIFKGQLVAVNATGFLVGAGDVAGLKVMGRADDSADNSAGVDGAASVRVQTGVFLWDNSVASAVDQAAIGHVVYAEDDHTVKKASASNSVIAGIAERIAPASELGGGVWVRTLPEGGI